MRQNTMNRIMKRLITAESCGMATPRASMMACGQGIRSELEVADSWVVDCVTYLTLLW